MWSHMKLVSGQLTSRSTGIIGIFDKVNWNMILEYQSLGYITTGMLDISSGKLIETSLWKDPPIFRWENSRTFKSFFFSLPENSWSIMAGLQGDISAPAIRLPWLPGSC